MSAVQKIINHRNPVVTVVIIAALLLTCVVPLAQAAFAKNTYRITDGDKILICTSRATDPAAVLVEAGLSLGEADTYESRRGDGVSEITVKRLQNVTLDHCGQRIEVQTYGETVGALLNRLGIVLSGSNSVSQPLSSQTYDGLVLTVAEAVQTAEHYTATIPFTTVYCSDDSVPEGTMVVLVAGTNGLMRCTALVSYINGVETERTVLSQEVISMPIQQVVAVGTGKG